MKRRYQVIIATTTGTLAAIAFGYFGVQALGKDTMYSISAGMFGLGTGASVSQVVSNRKQRRTVRT
ncbi:hypothetical protein ACX27_13815 [Nostoc piscinale CENA21]|uniref:Uncharacterized protein n=1 Tax=Nostoc piscinale CENA21 TaxID=224013 RepID=A0A0M3V5C5_9NOSO|nr:hypothetical protein [Nostoc piscinale]ALF53673.1 hypothetical protein ACX27_13815 [Nostoc piscinale CENA21]